MSTRKTGSVSSPGRVRRADPSSAGLAWADGAAIATDLRGASRLVIDAISGVTGIVEDMHRNIAGRSPVVGEAPTGGARGVSGFVYRTVRGVTRAVGFGIDASLAPVAPLLRAVFGDAPDSAASSPRREAVIAALNGVWGDHLAETRNPLAVAMRLRHRGEALVLDRESLAARFDAPSRRLLVLVHGLCMNDLEWERDGHDHGAELARDLDYVPLYLHYNSGLHISANGRKFADVMESLLHAWPAPVDEIAVVGHSMGGLVARSACHYAQAAGHEWPRRLRNLAFLGTPHQGAPLERAGNWADILVGLSPYTAPFTRLGKARSDGIKDLRRGNLLDEDWRDHPESDTGDRRTAVPLPQGVRCFAVAATRNSGSPVKRRAGDGLVPVDSALGRHADPARRLAIPAGRQIVVHGVDHFGLLGDRRVSDRLRDWFAES